MPFNGGPPVAPRGWLCHIDLQPIVRYVQQQLTVAFGCYLTPGLRHERPYLASLNLVKSELSYLAQHGRFRNFVVFPNSCPKFSRLR